MACPVVGEGWHRVLVGEMGVAARLGGGVNLLALPSRLKLVTGSALTGGAERVVPVPDAFEQFVAQRSAALLRTAWMLTGDEALAHDLVQVALERTWSRRARIEQPDALEAYVRRVMLSTYLTWRRRRWNVEIPTGSPCQASLSALEISDAAAVRAVVAAALAALPKRQRAVLVLRYFDDLSETSTAQMLGCSVGTVKSQAARGLARLRADAQMSSLWSGSDDD